MKKILSLILLSIATEIALAIAPPHPYSATADTWQRWEEMQTERASVETSNLGIRRMQQAVGTMPNPIPRVLVIMVNFQNSTFVSTRAEVDSMFNAHHWTKDGARGSIRQYFFDQSYGSYNPQFDVVGPVTVSKNNIGYTNGGYLAYEACTLVDDSVNFSLYDSNLDGKVDLVYVLYAGFAQNDPPSFSIGVPTNQLLWPNKWDIVSAHVPNASTAMFDGKLLYDYEIANELNGYTSTASSYKVAGIGVAVHEFCHALGLPDLYTTNKATHRTLRAWSIMDYGCYGGADYASPVAFTAYERWWMNWLAPKQLLTAETDTLRPIANHPDACYFTANGSPITNIQNPSPATFYLLEHRKRVGWDANLERDVDGMLLYKIQFDASNWRGNAVNNTASAMGVDILEADGIVPTDRNSWDFYMKQGDCYPYNDLDSILVVPTLPITHIHNDGQSIIFDVLGGSDTPTNLPRTFHERITNESRTHKVLKNGTFYVKRDDVLYTITGQKVQ